MSKTGNFQLLLLVLQTGERHTWLSALVHFQSPPPSFLLVTDVREIFDGEVQLVLAEQFP